MVIVITVYMLCRDWVIQATIMNSVACWQDWSQIINWVS